MFPPAHTAAVSMSHGAWYNEWPYRIIFECSCTEVCSKRLSHSSRGHQASSEEQTLRLLANSLLDHAVTYFHSPVEPLGALPGVSPHIIRCLGRYTDTNCTTSTRRPSLRLAFTPTSPAFTSTFHLYDDSVSALTSRFAAS